MALVILGQYLFYRHLTPNGVGRDCGFFSIDIRLRSIQTRMDSCMLIETLNIENINPVKQIVKKSKRFSSSLEHSQRK